MLTTADKESLIRLEAGQKLHKHIEIRIQELGTSLGNISNTREKDLEIKGRKAELEDLLKSLTITEAKALL